MYLAEQDTLTLSPSPGLSLTLEMEMKPPGGAGLTSVSGWRVRWSPPCSIVQERLEGGRLGEDRHSAQSSSSCPTLGGAETVREVGGSAEEVTQELIRQSQYLQWTSSLLSSVTV